MMIWQACERNEWALAIQKALTPAGIASANTSPALSLADRAVTTQILTAAGFATSDFAEVHEPVFYGPDVDVAHYALIGLFMGRTGLPVDAHLTLDGVLFNSRAWIVISRENGGRTRART